MRPASLLRRFCDLFLRDTRSRADVLCLHLHAGQELKLRDATRWVVECRGGTAWITQEGDSRDVIVATGERFVLDRDGLTLVSALDDAILAIHVPGTRTAGHRAPVADATSAGWLGALYPETRPWTPSMYRRLGML